MEKQELYDEMSYLPNSTIDFYEDIINSDKTHNVSMKWYYKLYVGQTYIFVSFMLLWYAFGYPALQILNYNFGMELSQIDIFLLAIFPPVLMFIKIADIYYKYYSLKTLGGFTLDVDLLLAGEIYRRYKKYFINDGPFQVNRYETIFTFPETKIQRFIETDINDADKDIYIKENISRLLHSVAQYHQHNYNGMNNEFINPKLKEKCDDEYIVDMCEKMNDAFINQRNKEAMFLARHILEVSIKHIFENDPEFRIEYQRDYKSNDGTTLGELVYLLKRRTGETYQTYVNGHFNTPEEFKGNVKSVNDSLNSFIHGDESFDEIFDEKQFKQDYEDIFRILLIIRRNVDMDQKFSDDEDPEPESSNSESENSNTEN